MCKLIKCLKDVTTNTQKKGNEKRESQESDGKMTVFNIS